MYLFFDTETTGLPDFYAPDRLGIQPHVVQLAALLTDANGVERASLKALIKPDGWTIPAGASRVHGISTEDCAAFGIPIKHAAAVFNRMLDNATVLVAHNIKFDLFLLDVECRRLGKTDFADDKGQFCTMEESAPIVNLPPTERMVAAGFDKPKPPKLEECIRHFFGEDLAGAHDAMADVRACARVFFELRRRDEEIAKP